MGGTPQARGRLPAAHGHRRRQPDHGARLMFDLLRPALQTDRTRVVTHLLSTFSVVSHLPGGRTRPTASPATARNRRRSPSSARSKRPKPWPPPKRARTSATSPSPAGSLLERTRILYGSCLVHANWHSTPNPPALLVGGGFKDGGHLAIDTMNNTPLANLFVTMMQTIGAETDRFSTSSGTLNGWES